MLQEITQETARNKRRYRRTEHPKGVRVVWQASGRRFISCVSNLSLGGAFIQTVEPLPVGTALALIFQLLGKETRVRAVVRRSVLGQGMGVEFVAMEPDARARLAITVESAGVANPREQLRVTNLTKN